MVTGVGTRVCHQHNFSLMGLVARDWRCVRLSLYCVALSSLRRRACRGIDGWREGRQRIRKETGRTCVGYELVEPAGITPLLSPWLCAIRATGTGGNRGVGPEYPGMSRIFILIR